MDINHKRVKPGVTIVTVAGEMDMYNSHELKSLVSRILAGTSDPLILDLKGLKYIDSSGVSVLIFVFTQARKSDIPLWYANVHGTVRKVIELTSLLNFFPIADTLEDAYKQAVAARGA
ncbi:MAG: STAS domain-containing protein [Spirochaetota bacterium]